ncbi:MAG: diacylglycerol kinase [Candidatus Omnitrophica bacterium]|nr:diacylglycerol kinase [Candidatus Omnitrophota bacterium]
MEEKKIRLEKSKFIDSLNVAVEGFIYVMKTQRNMRIHFLVAILVLVLGIYLDFSKTDFLFVLLAATLVLVTEMLNTSIEFIVDLMKVGYHPVAKIIKDVSAGAVFISAVNSILTGYIVFSKNFTINLEKGIQQIRQSSWHITFISLFVVLAVVVMGKVITRKGTPFRGGMPSGHAAFSFCIWMAIACSTNNDLITVLSFLMAVVIARHRVIVGIHDIWEVIAGALIGALSTALVFQILR